MRNPRVYYQFAWGNRELQKGTLLFLKATGKLNSVQVETVMGGKQWITDRRGLRRIGHECHCSTCPEYCMEDCVCGGICDCNFQKDNEKAKALLKQQRERWKRMSPWAFGVKRCICDQGSDGRGLCPIHTAKVIDTKPEEKA